MNDYLHDHREFLNKQIDGLTDCLVEDIDKLLAQEKRTETEIRAVLRRRIVDAFMTGWTRGMKREITDE